MTLVAAPLRAYFGCCKRSGADYVILLSDV